MNGSELRTRLQPERVTDRFYSGVSRYTTSGFLRIKLGEALQRGGVAPHIFESAENARSNWRNEEHGNTVGDQPAPRRGAA